MGKSIYTEDLAERICELIATSSKSMKVICTECGCEVATVLCWLSEGHRNYREEFAKMYARAKEMQAEFMAEEIIEIADDSSQDLEGYNEYGKPIENKEFVNRSRLRVDARKWAASKLKPKKFGDKIDVTSAGKELQATSVIITKEEAKDIADKLESEV